MATNNYIIISKTDPDRTTIVNDCTTKHQSEYSGASLSIVGFSNGNEMIKVKNGNSTWVNAQTWAASVITHLGNDTTSNIIRHSYAALYEDSIQNISGLELWVDGADQNAMTFDSANIVSFVEKSPHAYTMSVVAGNAVIDGTYSLMTFNADIKITNTGTTTVWKFLHNSEFTVAFSVIPNYAGTTGVRELLNTSTGIGTGFVLRYVVNSDTTDQVTLLNVQTGTTYVFNVTTATSLSSGTVKICCITWKDGISGDDVKFYNKSFDIIESEEPSTTVSASDPSYSLVLGTPVVGGTHEFSIFDIVVYSRALNDGEVDRVLQHMNYRAGLV